MNIGEKIAPPPAGNGARGRGWQAMLVGRPAAGAVLVLFWLFMVGSLREKSLTFDEVAYAAAGYAQWHYGDFRLQPENGQLPERMAGLPLELSLQPLPAPEPAEWRDADQWPIGERWLYRSGGDAANLGAEGRMACGLFAVALGVLVWAWSRRLFGPTGGMVSLLLYVMNPTVLANGALMTSDMATALFFAGAAGAIWALLARVTPGRLLLSALLMSALFLTKVSAMLIGPMALLLMGARLIDGRPLPFSIGPFHRELSTRTQQALAMAGAATFHALVAVILIWASYGFRYSAAPGNDPSGRFRIPWEQLLAKPDPVRALQALNLGESRNLQVKAILVSHGASEPGWSNRTLDAIQEIRRDVLSAEQGQQLDAILSKPSPEFWVRMIEIARRRHALPEAWIYGLTDVYRRAQVRVAFLNGAFSLRGWASFFPYSFLVKTPLALFGVILLAAAAAGVKGPQATAPQRVAAWARVYGTLPLWVLFSVYWAAAIASHLNIGHRHLLPAYPPLFILCGIAGYWFEAIVRPSRKGGPWLRGFARIGAPALGGLLVLGAVDTTRIFPDYLAYFNGIVRPAVAYRHLVDSSLDWGQDLPAVRAYVEGQPESEGPFYFSYFGTASPDYYGIRARPLYSVTGMDVARRPDWQTQFIPADEVAATLPRLRQEWPDHDVLGMQRLGETVAVTLLRKPGRLLLGAGTYLISASMLQPVNFPLSGPWGRWNSRYEAAYQELSATVKPLMSDDQAVLRAAIMRHSIAYWPPLLERFEEYRFGRLTAYLRQREPDDEIHFSILVYHLSGSEINRALEGPPPESAPDEQSREMEKLPGPGTD